MYKEPVEIVSMKRERSSSREKLCPFLYRRTRPCISQINQVQKLYCFVLTSLASVVQWHSGVTRGGGVGGSNPPFASKPFFHSRKVTVIKYYNLSLTTRRTINSHNLRKTNHLGGAIASMVKCVLTWIREQYLVVCNIAK